MAKKHIKSGSCVVTPEGRGKVTSTHVEHHYGHHMTKQPHRLYRVRLGAEATPKYRGRVVDFWANEVRRCSR